MSAIVIEDLTKEYGDVTANDAVSFSVDAGEVVGYLGPNGAGKTTTIRTLLGFQSPTAGTATVLGADVRDEAALVAARARIGYLPANPQFDERSTGRGVLDLHGSIKGDERRAELLDTFEVPLDRRVRSYSTGQIQKLGLVTAFMHDPDLVILDEPTSGLDPLLQQRFEALVRAEREAGTTVLLSSHVLSEVRRICDRVAVIRDGRIVAVERVADLLHRSGKVVRVHVATDLAEEDLPLSGVHDLTLHRHDGREDDGGIGGTELAFTYTGAVDELVAFLGSHRCLEVEITEAPLEDAFMRFYEDSAIDVDATAHAEPTGGSE